MPKINKEDHIDYKEIFELVFGNINIIDAEGKMLYVNQSAADYMGLPKDKLIGHTMESVVEADKLSTSAGMEALKQGKVIRTYQVNQDNEGILSIAVPIFDEDGKIRNVITHSLIEKELEELQRATAQEKLNLQYALEYIVNSNSISNPIVANSPKIRYVFDMAKRVSKTDSNILIVGESGTGKEVLAKYIHENSRRSFNVMIPVNCSAIPESLMESELFGYDKGAFTGAEKNGKPGLFEVADNGTLFLDEIGELPMFLQSKILRVLEDGDFKRIVSNKISKTNVRIIAATNRDLQKMVKEGTFREDLYYRLNVVTMELPPLRERKEDIIPLAEHFLSDLNKKYNYNKSLGPDTINAFMHYSWPGNIRELRNITESMLVTSLENIITLNNSIVNFSTITSDKAEAPTAESTDKEPEFEEDEKVMIENALSKTYGNVNKAAKILEINRRTLYRHINKYGIDVDSFR